MFLTTQSLPPIQSPPKQNLLKSNSSLLTNWDENRHEATYLQTNNNRYLDYVLNT